MRPKREKVSKACQFLRRCITETFCTQRHLAKGVGLSEGTISQIVSGKRDIQKRASAKRFSRFFNKLYKEEGLDKCTTPEEFWS